MCVSVPFVTSCVSYDSWYLFYLSINLFIYLSIYLSIYLYNPKLLHDIGYLSSSILKNYKSFNLFSTKRLNIFYFILYTSLVIFSAFVWWECSDISGCLIGTNYKTFNSYKPCWGLVLFMFLREEKLQYMFTNNLVLIRLVHFHWFKWSFRIKKVTKKRE